MKKIIILFVIFILFTSMGIFIPSIECQDSEVLTFDKAIISKIEAYDSLLLYGRDTVVPLYYPGKNVSDMMEIEDYYNPISNVNTYTYLMTGNQTIVDLEYYSDDKKLDNFFEQCYLEYNSCKNDIYLNMVGTQNKDIIKDVRAYVNIGNKIIEEYTFEEYSNLKNNNNFTDFRIKSINFIIEDKGSISERNEIIYDGIFLYHNYYLENKTLKWDLKDTHNSIRFSEGNISVPIFSLDDYTFEPVGTVHADEIARDILFNSFKRYYIKYEKYEDKEKWYFFNSEPLIKIKLVLLEYSKFTDNEYPDKKDLMKEIEERQKIIYSNLPPMFHIFTDGTINSRINIVISNPSPEILQIDSNIPPYPNYFLEDSDKENKLLWDKFKGVRNLLLINYLNRRIEESGYIINFEYKYFKEDEKLKILTKEDLELKKEYLGKLDSFLVLSKYYNERLYTNYDNYEYGKRDMYLKNSVEIESQRNFTGKLIKSLENEIDKRQWETQKRQYTWAFFFTIIFGMLGFLSFILYIDDKQTKNIDNKQTKDEEWYLEKEWIVIILTYIIFFVFVAIDSTLGLL